MGDLEEISRELLDDIFSYVSTPILHEINSYKPNLLVIGQKTNPFYKRTIISLIQASKLDRIINHVNNYRGSFAKFRSDEILEKDRRITRLCSELVDFRGERRNLSYENTEQIINEALERIGEVHGYLMEEELTIPLLQFLQKIPILKSEPLQNPANMDEFNNFIELKKEEVDDSMKTERYPEAWGYIEVQRAANLPIGDGFKICGMI